LSVGLVACGESGAGDENADEAVAAAPPRDASAPALLSPGRSVRVFVESDALVSVLASRTPRRDVLNALSDAAGFILVVGPEVDLGGRVTLQVEREPLEVALARVLAGIPHALYYAENSASSVPRLDRVTVGVDWTKLAESTTHPPLRSERGAKPAPPGALANLRSGDEELRREAVARLDVRSSEGFEAAVHRLAKDESPLVRVAAAEALVGAGAGAIPPLLQALDDPDPRVVLAALGALEFVGDASVIPGLSPLLDDRDVEVRERALVAIELLR
jgi:hypothetical protein